MRKLVLLAGVPGTGKSTFAKSNFDLSKVKVISSDEIRFELTHDFSIILEDMNVVYDEMIRRANDIFIKHNDATIILDSTFLNDNRRNYFLDKIECDYVVLYMLKVHDIDTIYKRNKSRIKQKWVPEDVILKMWESFSYPDEISRLRYNEIQEVYVDE